MVRNTILRKALSGVSLFALLAGQSLANPSGGTVAAGGASITPSGSKLTIDQNTKIVIIDWNQFNIGAGETTQFLQPSSSALVVNRIGGQSPAQILGNLLANGRVILIDGNGILFGPKARVNVNSLIATTSDASNEAILSGTATFNPQGNANATITNQGAITAATGGLVGLIAPAVSNSGVIRAKLGTVQLAGANVFTVDFTGDGLISFPVDPSVLAAAITANGQPVKALVSNAGKIQGASVIMTARAAANLVENAISMGGEVEATSAHEQGGTIVLDGGQGSIALNGTNLNASGKNGGGSITVGSWNASSVTADAATTLNASATETGNGGSISVISQDTSFQGTAKAQGGADTGNGGTVETSGNLLAVNGATVSTLAPHGLTGTWTLDPYNVTISDGSTASGSIASNTFTPSGSNSVLNATTLENALASNTIVVTTGSTGSDTGDITVAAPLTWSANTLTLQAYHSIYIDAPVSATGTAGLVLTTNNGGSGGDYTFNGGGITFANTSEALTINGVGFTLVNNVSSLASAISGNASSDYALANSYNAGSDGTYATAPVSTTFTGTFEGLGNTISNLSIINHSGKADIGLFAEISSGTVRDIGLVGDKVDASGTGSNVGGLVGDNGGTVEYSYATGAVFGGSNNAGGLVGVNSGTVEYSYVTGTVSGGGTRAGGLVGFNGGTVEYSYATGAVRGGSFGTVGGLVGENSGDFDNNGNSGNSGTIEYSYATGAVSGGHASYAGGLVGLNGGTVEYSYATGAVNGGNQGFNGGTAEYLQYLHAIGAVSGPSPSPTKGGGVVDYDSFGTYIGDYFDSQTTGTTTGSGSGSISGVTAQTTAQLQGSLPSGFSSSIWGTGTGLYPYFLWQYPTTPQAISGTAYRDAGVTEFGSALLGTVTTSLLVNGTNAGSATTGANGYYYILVAPGTFNGSNQVLTYLNINSAGYANTYVSTPSATVAGADLYVGYLRLISGAATTSSMFSGAATATGSNTGIEFLYAGASLAANTGLDIESSNTSGLAIDNSLNAGTRGIIVDGAGPVTQSGTLSAGDLELLGASASYRLTDGNSVSTLAADTGAISFANSTNLSVGSVNGVTGLTSSGAVTLEATGSLTIAAGANVSAGNADNVVLSASSNFVNDLGSNALSVSDGGRWLIYSNNPLSDRFDNLNSNNTPIWDATVTSPAPGSVTQSGNIYLFAEQPTLAFTPGYDNLLHFSFGIIFPEIEQGIGRPSLTDQVFWPAFDDRLGCLIYGGCGNGAQAQLKASSSKAATGTRKHPRRFAASSALRPDAETVAFVQ